MTAPAISRVEGESSMRVARADREEGAERYSFPQLMERCTLAAAHWIKVANTSPESRGRLISIPPIDFDLRGRCAGQAVFSRTPGRTPVRLRINADLLARYPRRIIQQTVPHEVAHVVARAWWPSGIRSHGPEWQSVMRLFGKPADRCHDMVVVKARNVARFEYTCRCPEKIHSVASVVHNKILGGATYRCPACRSRIAPATSNAAKKLRQ